MKIYTTNTAVVSDNEALLRQALERLQAEAERLAMALRLAEEHINALTPEWYSAGQRVLAEIRAAQQSASVDEVKETDLWRCTVCGRVGTVGRCCGEETREPVNYAVLSEEDHND
jgi:predicted  nucleic acid-binding Zn-ribbon protein